MSSIKSISIILSIVSRGDLRRNTRNCLRTTVKILPWRISPGFIGCHAPCLLPGQGQGQCGEPGGQLVQGAHAPHGQQGLTSNDWPGRNWATHLYKLGSYSGVLKMTNVGHLCFHKFWYPGYVGDEIMVDGAVVVHHLRHVGVHGGLHYKNDGCHNMSNKN